MEKITLAGTDLVVSRVCLGTRRNAAARAPAAALAKVDAATDALKARLFAAYGGCVDQYAPESRVHGNDAAPRVTCAVL